MTLTIELSPEQSESLRREASRRGIPEQALAAEWIGGCLSTVHRELSAWSGAQAIDHWNSLQMPDFGSEDLDSPALARKLREAAQHRNGA